MQHAFREGGLPAGRTMTRQQAAIFAMPPYSTPNMQTPSPEVYMGKGASCVVVFAASTVGRWLFKERR